MTNLIELNPMELELITGGNAFDGISKLFGRKGKPFLSREVVENGSGMLVGAIVTLATHNPKIGKIAGAAAIQIAKCQYETK